MVSIPPSIRTRLTRTPWLHHTHTTQTSQARMTRIAFLDCRLGAAGDMLLAACLDAVRTLLYPVCVCGSPKIEQPPIPTIPMDRSTRRIYAGTRPNVILQP